MRYAYRRISISIMRIFWIARVTCYSVIGMATATYYVSMRPSIGGRSFYWQPIFLCVWSIAGIVGAIASGFCIEMTIDFLQLESEDAKGNHFVIVCLLTFAVILVVLSIATFALAPFLEEFIY